MGNYLSSSDLWRDFFFLSMAGTSPLWQARELVWLRRGLSGVHSRVEMPCTNSLLLSLSILSRAWNKLSHTGSFDSEISLLKLAVAMVPCGIKLGKQTQKQQQKGIEWISRLVIDQEIFRGILINIQARARIASVAKQIQIVQELASPDGLLTHLGALLSV